MPGKPVQHKREISPLVGLTAFVLTSTVALILVGYFWGWPVARTIGIVIGIAAFLVIGMWITPALQLKYEKLMCRYQAEHEETQLRKQIEWTAQQQTRRQAIPHDQMGQDIRQLQEGDHVPLRYSVELQTAFNELKAREDAIRLKYKQEALSRTTLKGENREEDLEQQEALEMIEATWQWTLEHSVVQRWWLSDSGFRSQVMDEEDKRHLLDEEGNLRESPEEWAAFFRRFIFGDENGNSHDSTPSLELREKTSAEQAAKQRLQAERQTFRLQQANEKLDREALRRWQTTQDAQRKSRLEEARTGGAFREYGLVHITAKGHRVRSKSEVIIANLLYAKSIEYEYEKPLTSNGLTRRPDFTVYDKRTGRTYYWEHLGMMDNVQYRHDWTSKLLWLRDQGILPIQEGGGPNGILITTTETTADGIDSQEVLRWIYEAFGA